MAAQLLAASHAPSAGGGASDTTSSPALAVHLITTVSSDTGRRGSAMVSRARKKGHATRSAAALPLATGGASPSSAATAAGKLRLSVGCVHVVPSRNSGRRRHEKGAADEVGVAVGAADGDARALADAVSESDRRVAVGETAVDGDPLSEPDAAAEGVHDCFAVTDVEECAEAVRVKHAENVTVVDAE